MAATLGIADLLANGPRGADELAEAAGAHAPTLYRLLRALANVGLFAEGDDGRFGLTPLAEYPRSGVPGSLRAWAMQIGRWPILLKHDRSTRCSKVTTKCAMNILRRSVSQHGH